MATFLSFRFELKYQSDAIQNIYMYVYLSDCLVSYIAPHLLGWNITAESITSTTVLVTWPNVGHAFSTQDLYGFVATCTATEIKDTLRLAAANASSSSVLVQTLIPYTEYQVQVVTLSKGESNGTILERSSSVVVLRTEEDGEMIQCTTVYLTIVE